MLNFNNVALLGLIILSRRLIHPWDLVVGIVLTIIGFIGFNLG
jgi:hypothetical protein